jgi:hypothetical protein
MLPLRPSALLLQVHGLADMLFILHAWHHMQQVCEKQKLTNFLAFPLFDVLLQSVLDIPPEVSTEAALEHVPASKFSYDIAAAASRQSHFYYQVSLPHYRDPVFISAAMKRYVLITWELHGFMRAVTGLSWC